jgi:hypothetical protein
VLSETIRVLFGRAAVEPVLYLIVYLLDRMVMRRILYRFFVIVNVGKDRGFRFRGGK